MQHGQTLEHELARGGEDVGLLELAPLVGQGGLGVDPLVDGEEPLLALLFRYLRVDVLQDFLQLNKTKVNHYIFRKQQEDRSRITFGIKFVLIPTFIINLVEQTHPHEDGGVLELGLLGGEVLGRLDERLDEQRVLGDPRRNEEDALGHALLLQQRVVGALTDELLEAAVALRDVLEEVHRLGVLAAECAVGVFPRACVLSYEIQNRVKNYN